MSSTTNNSDVELMPQPAEQKSSPNLSGETSKSSFEPEPLQPIEKMPNPNLGSQAPQSMPVSIPDSTLSKLTQSDDSTTTTSDDKQISDDNDLIEKEWVDKVKAIVSSTREDPYKQNESLTNLKAEYMKQQFNKTIKLIK